MESLKELSLKCQKGNYKITGNWMVRTFLRDLALPLTWALLHTPITANQVTFISLIVGIWGIFLISSLNPFVFLCGVSLLQLWYYLDHVDGQIARYRGTASMSGRYFDFLTHHIIHCALFFSMGFYCFLLTQKMFFLIFAFVTALSVMIFNIVNDTKYKTFFEKLVTLKDVSFFEGSKNTTCQNKTSWPKRLFSFLHKTVEIHVMMNVISLTAILSMMPGMSNLRYPLFVLYGAIIFALAVLKNMYLIGAKKIDSEFKELIK